MRTNDDNGHALEFQAEPIEETTALSAITRGEVDIQVATARRFPRSIKRFKSEALSLATLDEETAQSCRYVVPRSGKMIEGPSVRLAEIVASCWGNLRCESRVIDEGQEFLTAQATSWDMERNVLIRIEVRRRITDKRGRRFNEDMRGVAGNAACSIALRNAILRTVPAAFVRPIYDAVCQTVMGDISTLAQRREKALAWFAARGAPTERVLTFLGRDGIEDVNLEDVATLNGIRVAVNEGTVSIDDAFDPDGGVEKPAGSAAERRSAKPKAQPVKRPEPEPEPPLTGDDLPDFEPSAQEVHEEPAVERATPKQITAIKRAIDNGWVTREEIQERWGAERLEDLTPDQAREIAAAAAGRAS